MYYIFVCISISMNKRICGKIDPIDNRQNKLNFSLTLYVILSILCFMINKMVNNTLFGREKFISVHPR